MSPPPCLGPPQSLKDRHEESIVLNWGVAFCAPSDVQVVDRAPTHPHQFVMPRCYNNKYYHELLANMLIVSLF